MSQTARVRVLNMEHRSTRKYPAIGKRPMPLWRAVPFLAWAMLRAIFTGVVLITSVDTAPADPFSNIMVEPDCGAAFERKVYER